MPEKWPDIQFTQKMEWKFNLLTKSYLSDNE